MPIYISSARLVALGRLGLAISLMVLAVTDVGHVGFEWEADDVIALSYTAISMLAAAIAWRNWYLDYRIRLPLLSADILVFILLPSMIEPLFTGYRIAALTSATFILLSVALRWDWRLAGVTAVVLNLMNWLIATFQPLLRYAYHLPVLPEASNDAYFIRSIYYLLLVSFLIVWVGSRISPLRAGRFVPVYNELDEAALAEALHFALASCGGGNGALTWQRHNSELGPLTVGEPEDLDDPGHALIDEFIAEVTSPILFKFGKGAALCVDLNSGEIAICSAPSGLTRLSNGLASHESGFLIPLFGVSGEGMLLVHRVKAPSTDLLNLLISVGKELTDAFDRQQARHIEREEAFADLRKSLARDLHDSVAQSLAGTRYWLTSLQSDPAFPQSLNGEIEKIDRALETETKHIRGIIGSLQQDELPDASPTSVFQSHLDSMASQWRISVTLMPDAHVSDVPLWLFFDILQLTREAVSNSARHGKASNVGIDVQDRGAVIELAVADDGIGFTGIHDGVQPEMISNRVEQLGGKLMVETGSEGTTMRMTIPVEKR